MIKSQIVRGSKLISDVRTLTSLDENEISLEKIDISKFLKESIKFVKKAYTDRGLSIIRGDHNEKYYINANELLQDVFDNILINSVKYNENTVVEINIKICKVVIDKKDYIKIEFIDNGIGVEDIRKTLIFQPGQREIKGTKGMGMGLSLVSKIMEIFDGKIWVEDKVKGDYTQGSNFVLLLPKFKKV
jgi:signal transduction histidine kinase